MRTKRFTGFDVIVYMIATVLLLIVLYPLILVVSNSISDPGLVASGKVWLFPKKMNLEGYRAVFGAREIMVGYANTFFYTVVGTIINLIVTLPAGYALTKKTMPGRNLIMTMFMITMYFSGGMIPTFLVINKLGLYNSRWVLLISGAFSVYNCIICRSFFDALPRELEESAEIDGCSPPRIFMQIVMPLSKALLGVMVLYFGVGHWNSYFNAMIYILDEDKKPLQLVLRRILVQAQSLATSAEEGGEYANMMMQREQLIRYAVIVVSAAPLMILYPFLQKYFDKGVLIGSVKG